jgi:NitT/TauT family transport system substrate-binding protein
MEALTKPLSGGAYTGAPIARVEDMRLLTGTATFVDDLALPGMLHAVVLRSAVAHGTIEKIDASAALALEGVHAVITADDVGDEIPLIPIRLAPLPEFQSFRQPVIARDKVRYVGEPIAIIVAESRAIAEDAMEVIELEISALPSVANIASADTAQDAARLFGAETGNLAVRYLTAVGDADAAFAEAAYVRTERFSVHRQTALPMETRGLLSSDIGLFLAEQRGYFRDEGLKVEIDVGAGATSAGLYNAVNRGLKIKVVADKGTNSAEYGYKALMVRTDLIESGKFKTLADLKGKKVAIIAKGAADESVINQALLKAGLADNDIERVFLPFSQHMSAFVNKAIDAAISSEPGVSLMTKEKAAVRFSGLDAFYPVQQTAVLLMNGRFFADKETAVKFLKAYLRGVRDYTATLAGGKISGPNADKMIASISEMTGIRDLSLLRDSVPPYIDPNGALALDSIKMDFDYFRQKGLVAKDVDLNDVVDTTLVKQAVEALGQAPLSK